MKQEKFTEAGYSCSKPKTYTENTRGKRCTGREFTLNARGAKRRVARKNKISACPELRDIMQENHPKKI